jgi:hypothetical protein
VNTVVSIDGTKFLFNGRPTYQGVRYRGMPVEGLLFNSRMIQAVFDDDCPETRKLWAYPDTGVWDPDRNTNEFCAHLPEYRSYGLLAVTVGLQGGGSNYRPEVYGNYVNSAYEPDGTLKQPYFDRLLRVLKAADEAGMALIVNYFYWKQVERIKDDRRLFSITQEVTDWLLRTGYRNILVDVANECADWWRRRVIGPDNIHTFIDIVKGTMLDGRRLLVGSSSGGGEELPHGRWLAAEDFSMPHGNGCNPIQLKGKLRRLRGMDEYLKRPRPVCINEDGLSVENLEMALSEYASWGFYCQGYGSDNRDEPRYAQGAREARYEDLTGFQTLPVNWDINDPFKRAFFDRVKAITQGG